MAPALAGTASRSHRPRFKGKANSWQEASVPLGACLESTSAPAPLLRRPCVPLRPEHFPCPRRASAFAGPRCRAAGAALAAMPAALPGMPMPARAQNDRSPGCRDRGLACGPALPAPAALPQARASRRALEGQEGQREGQGQASEKASGKASGKTGRQASAKAREKPGRGALRPAFGKQAWGKPGMGPLAGFSPARGRRPARERHGRSWPSPEGRTAPAGPSRTPASCEARGAGRRTESGTESGERARRRGAGAALRRLCPACRPARPACALRRTSACRKGAIRPCLRGCRE